MGVVTEAVERERPGHEFVLRGVRRFAAPALLTSAGFALWLVSLPAIDLSRMNDAGLVSVLPGTFYLALGLLTASFFLSVRDIDARRLFVVANVLVLILVVYGTLPIIEHELRFEAAWRHAGVIEAISRTGHVNPDIDAYFDWPGFFIIGVLFTHAAGVDSAVTLARWAPIVFNLLYLPALLTLFRSASRDERLAWLAVWVFYSTEWVGQDYFSPQALSYFLYLVVLTILVRWFVRNHAPRWLRLSSGVRESERTGSFLSPRGETELSSGQRAGLMAIVVAVIAVLAPMHQLTPTALLLGLTALVVVGCTKARALPLISLVATAAWIIFMATTYLKGHVGILASQIGKLESNVSTNVSSRISGSALHTDVARERLAFTVAVWGAAVFGAYRALRAGRLFIPFVALAAAPAALVILQPYGGEIVLRTYLFMLPFSAFFVASLLEPLVDRASASPWPKMAVAIAVALVLLGGLLVARSGNERAEYFTTGDVAAVREMYRVAPPGSLLIAGSNNLPWKFKGYDQYDYRVVSDLPEWDKVQAVNGDPAKVVPVVAEMMRSRPDRAAYLIFTRSEKAYAELFGYSRPGYLTRFEQAVRRSPEFNEIYGKGNARIFVLARQAHG